MYIDLSKYNRVTDWKKVSEQVEGVILRVGYRGYGSGKIVLDSAFESYAKACYNYGVPMGLYFMSQAITIPEAIEEADFSLNYAEKYKASLPIFIDSEDGDGTAKVVRADALSRNDRTDICDYFCKTVTESHKRAGTYASTSWFANRLNVNKLDKYLLWVAQYNTINTAKHRVDMWQYTNNGSVAGIQGRVDCSKLYGFPAVEQTTTTRLLKRGSSGSDVRALQSTLNLKYNAGLKIDGVFGPATETAVKNVQRMNGLKVDGIVGEQTRKVL